jgi:hypothetical protein
MGFHQRRTDCDLGALAALAVGDFTFVSRARRQLRVQGNVRCIEARSIDACIQLSLRSGAVALHRRF